MKITYRIILLLSCCFWLLGLQAQTVRTISVSQETSYTDHISLKEDTKDMDLMVKFVFSEALIKGRKLRPDQLPYVVEFDPKDKYKVTKLFKATVPQPREDYYFRRWIEYDGLQPAPQEYKMVNDFITQTFDIPNKRNQVSVKLRDVFLLDKIEKKKYNLYQIPLGRDLDMEYQVTIERNPCFGLDEDIAAAKGARESIQTSYASFFNRFGNGKTISSDMKKVFDDMKSTLLDQFKPKDIVSPCPEIQEAWDDYNNYIDSISSIKCIVQDPVEVGTGGDYTPESLKILVSKAREIDKMVSRWLVSSDPIEKNDLVKRTRWFPAGLSAATR